MPKSEKLFDMLEYVKEYPGLTAKDLSKLCNVSERGIYRYLNTLSRAGISIRFKKGGYRLQEDYRDIVRDADPEDLEALRVLLLEGMRVYEDDQVVQRGKRLMKQMGMDVTGKLKGQPGTIEIVSERTEPAYKGGTITIGHSSKPDIINPILTSETISVNLMSLIFSSLVRFDSAQRPVPDLAQRWEVSKDGLVWTFYLRRDVSFHDGHPLTARDVEFTYRAMMDPKNMSPMAERYKLIQEIEIEGDHIFRVILKHPFAPFIFRLSREIAPMHLLENADVRDTPFNRHPVGSGPFKLADWMEDDTIVLEANREYFHKDRPILDRLVFKAYADRKSAMRAMGRGRMDIAFDLAASDLLSVGRRGSFRIYSAPGASYYAILLNLKDPLFQDIRVRKALDYAIDRDSIITNQLKGYSSICTGPFNVNSWAYNPDVKATPHSPEKAAELLEQAGWVDTDGDGILDKDGRPLEISLTVPNISDSLERIVVAIRAQLMKVGISLDLVYLDDPEPDKAAFQMILAMVIAGTEPDRAYRFWHSQGGEANLSSYQNKLVDNLLEQGRQTTDLEERKAIYHKVHEVIHHDCPAIFLASGREFIGSRYRFGNTRFSSLVHFLTTAKDWQIAGKQRKNTINEHHEKVISSKG